MSAITLVMYRDLLGDEGARLELERIGETVSDEQFAELMTFLESEEKEAEQHHQAGLKHRGITSLNDLSSEHKKDLGKVDSD